MDRRRGSFEALVYGDPSPYSLGNAFVSFVREPNHGCIASYALLSDFGSGGTICVS
jgi:hypothetical protein